MNHLEFQSEESRLEHKCYGRNGKILAESQYHFRKKKDHLRSKISLLLWDIFWVVIHVWLSIRFEDYLFLFEVPLLIFQLLQIIVRSLSFPCLFTYFTNKKKIFLSFLKAFILTFSTPLNFSILWDLQKKPLFFNPV